MSLRRDQPNAHFVYLFSGLAVGTAIGIYIGNKRRTGPPQRRDDNGDGDPPSPSTPKPLSAMMNDSLTQQRRPSRIELDSKMFQGATTNQYSNMSIPSTSPDAVMTRKQVPFPSLSSADAAATAAAAGGANASSSSSSSNAVVPKPLMRLKDTASWSQMAALVTPGKYKYVLAMVGLPARGKSYLVKMIMRYLRWTGISSEIFNVGNFRRKRGMGAVPSTFFDKNNADAQNKREQLAKAVQDDMYRWLQEQEDLAVAFFDATNTTKARRAAIMDRARREPNTYLLFVESICDDPVILERNYRMKLKNQDYKDQDPVEALKDFKERVVQYEAVYEEVVDEEDGGNVSFIKIYNVGQKVVTRRCSGYIPSQVAFHLMNVHVSPRKIWLSRHAEGTDQMRGLLGGDSGEMTRYGEEYAFQLAQYVSDSIKELRAQRKRSRSREESSNANAPGAQQQQPQSETEAPGTPSSRVQFTGSVEEEPLDSDEYRGDELVVMLGTQAIHHSTVKHVMAMNPDVKFVSNSILNELRGGELDKMSHSEIKQKYPQVWEARMKDKLHFRYPGAGGESYIDVIQRVKPVIVELERQRKSVLVVSHLAVQRCLYAYFSGIPIEDIPTLNLPNHVVTELSIEPHGTVEKHPRLANTSEMNRGRFDRALSSEQRDALEVARMSQGLPKLQPPAESVLHRDSGYPWMAEDDGDAEDQQNR